MIDKIGRILFEKDALEKEDFSQSPANNINWDKVNFKILAIIFYMGRIYE